MKFGSGISVSMLAGALLAATVTAQPPAGGPGGPGGGGRRGQAAPPSIDLPTAKKMMAAAEAKAAELNGKFAIAIVDANGDLVLFLRMDGVTGPSVTTAQGKARAALLFGIPSKDVADAIASHKPVSVTLTSPQANALITAQQGGVPVFGKDGKIIAAIGAGGSQSYIDEKVSQAGADAVK